MVDFGAWAENKLAESGSDIQALSAESGLLYAYLNRLFNSGKKGKPIRPDQKTAAQIGEALVKLGAIQDKGEAEIAADYIPKGYKIVRESEASKECISYLPNPDTAKVAERYDNASPRIRKAVDALLDVEMDDESDGPSAARLAMEMDTTGLRGKRAK